MSRDDWMEGQIEQPPYGTNVAAPPDAAIRYHMTSGTTGKMPIRVLDSMKDWEWIAEMWCYGLWGFGVRPTDTLFVAFGYARSSASGDCTTPGRRWGAWCCRGGR
jgi:phenylacetate-CoA ligase